jgi:hypothetical protein
MQNWLQLLSILLLLVPGVPGQAPGIQKRPKPALNCPVSPTIEAKAPSEPGVDPLVGRWYVNNDRSIWAMLMSSWQAGRGNKMPWLRPAGVQLVITGRRLDGPASPLKATVAGNYSTSFQATGLEFPAEGCWEITGKAGHKSLTFVTTVDPRRIAVGQNGRVSLPASSN